MTREVFCCCGWRRVWCVLDTLTRCRLRPVCDAHDRVITGGFHG